MSPDCMAGLLPPAARPWNEEGTMRPTAGELARRIDVALGRAPADLAIRRARILDTGTGEIAAGDITVVGDTIVAVGEPRSAVRELDAAGRFAVPGLIDTHVHLESSMV